MKAIAWQVTRYGLSLAIMLCATVVSAQSYFISFAGTPSSIACTNTSFAFGAGLTYSWNLPSASTPIQIVGKAGATIISSGPQTFPTASGSGPIIGGPTYGSTPFPYTVTYTLTPQIPGATTSSFSFLCASATGSNFTFANGGPFGIASIPTLDRWELLMLVALLGVASVFLIRRRSGRR